MGAPAIVTGAASRDACGTAYGQHDGTFDGCNIGDDNAQLDDTVPLAAALDEAARAATNGGARQAYAAIGTADVTTAMAQLRRVQVAAEIISLPASDPQATVRGGVTSGADFRGHRGSTYARGRGERQGARLDEHDSGVSFTTAWRKA